MTEEEKVEKIRQIFDLIELPNDVRDHAMKRYLSLTDQDIEYILSRLIAAKETIENWRKKNGLKNYES